VVYPSVARHSGWTGVTRVQFQIGGDGRARDILVVGTSGYGVLDQAAERGVIAAGVLPRVYGKLEIPVRFALEGGR
jgi:TonB family protein